MSVHRSFASFALWIATAVAVAGCFGGSDAPVSSSSRSRAPVQPAKAIAPAIDHTGHTVTYLDERLPIERADISNTTQDKPIELAVAYPMDMLLPIEREEPESEPETIVPKTIDKPVEIAVVKPKPLTLPDVSKAKRLKVKGDWGGGERHLESTADGETTVLLDYGNDVQVLATLRDDRLILEYASRSGWVQLFNASGASQGLLMPGDHLILSGFLSGKAECRAAQAKLWESGESKPALKLGAAVQMNVINKGNREIVWVASGGQSARVPPGGRADVAFGHTRLLAGSRGGVVLSKMAPGVCETWVLGNGHLLSFGVSDDQTTYLKKSGAGALTVLIAQGGRISLPEGAFIKITGGLAASWDRDGSLAFGVVKSTQVVNIGGVDVFVVDSPGDTRSPLAYNAQRSLGDL